ISQAATLAVSVNAAAASKFALTGAASQTAGANNGLTITAQDAYGNIDLGYSGDHSLTFSGANASGSPVTQPTVTNKTPSAVNFGTATTITFASGVNSAGGTMKLYKVEPSPFATPFRSISQAATLAVTVNP